MVSQFKVRSLKGRLPKSIPRRRITGVSAVITHLNAPKAYGEKGGGHKVQVLQDNIVLYSGQHIGVVVADTFERAMYAASLVQVRYDEEKPTINMQG